ncbi:MAG: M23 family metallopeptidase [Candidatus Sumerlaeales bacterium]|nr:M23 family metallopeptidase [Candidatus Sumerlaeales bacterium]
MMNRLCLPSGRNNFFQAVLTVLFCVNIAMAAAAPAPDQPNISVTGVSEFQGRQTALIEDKNTGNSAFYRPGDTIYGWRLIGISGSGIKLEKNDKTINYPIYIAPTVALEGRKRLKQAGERPNLSLYDQEYSPSDLLFKSSSDLAKQVVEGKSISTSAGKSEQASLPGKTNRRDAILSKINLGRGQFAKPIASYRRISSQFGSRRHPVYKRTRFHSGMDLSAPTGTRVYASDSGQISFAGWRGGYGRCIIIDHHNGYKTLYGHMSRLLVSTGSNVKRGSTIGLVGSTGVSTGPHLHFEIRKNNTPINPASKVRF